MAVGCDCRTRTIQFFEAGQRKLSERRFDKYLKQLLLSDQESIDLFWAMYHSQRKKAALEDILGFYDFTTIATANKDRYPELAALVRKLQNEPHPACIIDVLWFIHALNQPFLRLFGLDLHRDRLKNPLLWHVITSHYYDQSPVRQIHDSPRNHYFSHIVQLFFEAVSPYFFTRPVTELQDLLFQLSPEEFGCQEWVPVVTLQRTRWHDTPPQLIRYRRKLTRWVLDRLQPTEVEIVPGPILEYRLLVWHPLDEEAKAVQRKFDADISGSPVVFAADPKYDIPYDVKEWVKFLPPK
jgi:hypothetical protein